MFEYGLWKTRNEALKAAVEIAGIFCTSAAGVAKVFYRVERE
jgi:hypothetical protein